MRVTLVDRLHIVSNATLAAFDGLGWQAERLSADVFDFFDSPRQFDLVTANLFLHHFQTARLAELLPLSLASKQRLLEMDDARDRLEILRRLISSSGQ